MTESDAFAPRWERPRPGARGLRFDILFAVIMLGMSALTSALYYRAEIIPDPAEWWVAALMLVAMHAPLAVRRRWPEVTALACSAAYIASTMLLVPEFLGSQITLFIAIYTIGAWGRHRKRALIVRGVIILGMFLWLFWSLVQQNANPSALPGYTEDTTLSMWVSIGLINIITNLLYFGGAYYFGERAWTAAHERAVLVTRTAELAAERERTSQQAVALERVRIARELHDVVAHHVSVMGVQAGAARRVLTRDTEKAEQALSAVESNARDAVDELHRMLTTLRQDDESTDSAVLSPSTRGVDQIESLVGEVEATGRRVRFEQVGETRPVSPAVDMTLHRVTQEALTNVIKHAAPDAAIDVRLRYLAEAVEVEVSNGGGPRPPRAEGSGLGQVGMRERVSALGGQLEMGPRKAGGYLVRAALPTSPVGGTT
ncbi:MAG: sensor histidine kinase [Microbacteriaceae bacterium]